MKNNIYAAFLIMIGLIIGSTLGYKTIQLRESVTKMDLEIKKLELALAEIEQNVCPAYLYEEGEDHDND